MVGSASYRISLKDATNTDQNIMNSLANAQPSSNILEDPSREDPGHENFTHLVSYLKTIGETVCCVSLICTKLLH